VFNINIFLKFSQQLNFKSSPFKVRRCSCIYDSALYVTYLQ